MDNILAYINLAAFVLLLVAKLRFELHMMQQNSYRNERYFRWIKINFITKLRISEALVLLLITLAYFLKLAQYVFFATPLLYILIAINYLHKKQKLKLVFTKRAQRLFYSMLTVLLVGTLVSWMAIKTPSGIFITLTLMVVLSPLVVLVINQLMIPIENNINEWFVNDARRIVATMPNLIIIGITGSYGKTSTKHFLHRILSEKYNVLMTPGSFNTTMGVVRTIREHLNATHQIFIVEMGAKQPGDIKEICDLVKPRYGILTAVGEQHLETFKTIENVRNTKFELINALPPEGIAILNSDYEWIAKTSVTHTKTIYYGLENPTAANKATGISYDTNGATFSINNGTTMYTTPLLGDYNISNILACILLAEQLGLENQAITYGVKKLVPVEHRLEIKRNPDGITIIDDAFNSNPKGAEMAMKVLSNFNSGKRIVVTPGIIELAAKHAYYNSELGKQIAQSADYAILVGKKQTEPIYNGLKSAGFPDEKIYIASDLNDALRHMNSFAGKGDTVLFENDLPDLFLN